MKYRAPAIYRPVCPANASQPLPGLIESVNRDPQLLLLSWSGRFSILGAFLLALSLFGLLLWGRFRLLCWLFRRVRA